MMRIAILSDVHGCPIALDAVLADIDKLGGVDGYWFLGDYAAIGYDPVTVLETITQLPNTVFIRGNTDRYVFTGVDRPPPHPKQVLAQRDLMPKLLEIERGFAWTQGYLTPSGWCDWLEQLPIEHRLTLPDGTRALLVHASPGLDDGDGFAPPLEDAAFAKRLNNVDADMVVVGHTHWPVMYTVNGVRIINPGSVGNPPPKDLRASFAILDADESGCNVSFYKTSFDTEAVIAAAEKARFPGIRFLTEIYRGERESRWSSDLQPPYQVMKEIM